ncbi:hypothetical protein [Paraburkholderia sp. J63]|uniref:hypothetical protein n=1 Tax=Paraburkholderia sp. J63 TaxID=2805434 RepID=UPI002ABD75CE|nr:hypothetical protein [Paraburkholderia sp. J63]
MPNVEQLKDMLDKAEDYTAKARDLQTFVAANPALPDQLKSANEAVAAVRDHIESVETRITDILAACEISSAIAELNVWVSNPNGDNAAAAAAFDKLFGGVAHYAAKLPPPVSAYAKVLEQIGISRFFTNMQDKMNPEGSGPHGRQLREVLDTIDNQFRPAPRNAP